MNLFSRILAIRRCLSHLGIFAGVKWCIIFVANRKRKLSREVIYINPKCLTEPVAVRMQDSSDINVFNQLFVRREALFVGQVGTLRTVVDLGANVGYFSAYVLSTHENAIVIAVEPEPGNAQMCRQNLKPYGLRARVYEGAIWHSQTRLVVSRGTFGDGREWATEVREAVAGENCDVTSWDMPALIGMCPFGDIDLLKVDIEGSEEQLFAGEDNKWLDHVRNICIEIHDKENCRSAVKKGLSPFEYERSECGEYTLFMNLKRKISAIDRYVKENV